MIEDLAFAPATDIATRVRSGELSAREVADAALARIEATDDALHAFTYVDADGARAEADAIDAARSAGRPLGRLAGVPVGVKDLVAVRGMPMERGSPLYRGAIADEDGIAVRRLRADHAVIVGKTTTPEFGHLGYTHSQLGPATRNPWSRAHTPGGSSGGSGVAVAAGQVPLAIGTDGGGSIRIPASCCGIVGFKPTLFRVPHVPLDGGLDTLTHTGPMARTTADAALMLAVMAGAHESDWASLPGDGSEFTATAESSAQGGRVAWAPQLGAAPADPEVVAVCERSLPAFESAGCAVELVEPFVSDWTGAWRVMFEVVRAEQVRERIDEVRAKSDRSLLAFVEAGLTHPAVDLMRATTARRAIWDQFAPVYREFDVIVTPTLLEPPLAVDPRTGVPDDPLDVFDRWFRHVFLFNMTGQPAITLPAGVTSDGLPVGIQIVAPRFADTTALRYAAAFEAGHPEFGPRPPEQVG